LKKVLVGNPDRITDSPDAKLFAAVNVATFELIDHSVIATGAEVWRRASNCAGARGTAAVDIKVTSAAGVAVQAAMEVIFGAVPSE